MKRRNSRRGVAIEFAIGLMLLVIAFSTLMVTVSMLQVKLARNDLSDFKEKITQMQYEDLEIDQSHTITINGIDVEVNKSE